MTTPEETAARKVVEAARCASGAWGQHGPHEAFHMSGLRRALRDYDAVRRLQKERASHGDDTDYPVTWVATEAGVMPCDGTAYDERDDHPMEQEHRGPVQIGEDGITKKGGAFLHAMTCLAVALVACVLGLWILGAFK